VNIALGIFNSLGFFCRIEEHGSLVDQKKFILGLIDVQSNKLAVSCQK